MTTDDGAVVGTVQIVDNGPTANLFNIVILAEGYRQNELSTFATDARDVVDAMRSADPYRYVWEAINVFRVDIRSTDSGADDPGTCDDGSTGSGYRANTYFDATFCSSGLRRLLTCDVGLALSTAAAAVPAYDLVLVLVNSPNYGGSGGSIATFSPSALASAIHEIGHTAFQLADEYGTWQGCGSGETDRNHHPGGEPSQVNVTTHPFTGQLKWSSYVLPGTALPTTTNPNCSTCDPQASPVPAGRVGAFEGADYYHCGAWRPEFDCRMNHLAADYCHVCSGHIMAKLAFYRQFKLRFAWKGFGGDWNIYIGEGLDNDQVKLNAFGTGNPPALAAFDGISMAWRGAANDQQIWYSNLNSIDGVTWSSQRAVSNALTSTAPALAPWNGNLYMAWKAQGGDQSLYFNAKSPGTGWSTPAPIPNAGTSSQPALCGFDGRLFAAWKGINGEQGIFYGSYDGHSWQPQRPAVGFGTSHYPALATFQGRLHMAWKGAGSDTALYWATYDGANWSGQQRISGLDSSYAPSLTASGRSLFIAFVGPPGDPSLYYAVFDGSTWTPRRNYFGTGSSAGPVAIVH